MNGLELELEGRGVGRKTGLRKEGREMSRVQVNVFYDGKVEKLLKREIFSVGGVGRWLYCRQALSGLCLTNCTGNGIVQTL